MHVTLCLIMGNQKQVRINTDLHEQLKKLARQSGLSISLLTTIAVSAGIQQAKEVADAATTRKGGGHEQFEND